MLEVSLYNRLVAWRLLLWSCRYDGKGVACWVKGQGRKECFRGRELVVLDLEQLVI